eukprot:m.49580 g.49580  ORF g.49580 m.49580 type:complete len:341 (-) comp6487_c0_seq3:431-1453(-)
MNHLWRIALLVVAAAAAARAAEDPDVHRNFCGIVQAKQYGCSALNFTTSDGYILELFRIGSPSQGKPVALLWHGLLDSSFTWILNYPSQSLPYLLADAGYDVWLANSRGNRFARRHTHLSPDSDAFWAFTWDEMARIDVPEVIKHILSTTGQQSLAYVGHSQGTAQMFAALSQHYVPSESINVFVALAPVAYVGHVTNILLKYLSKPAVLSVASLLLGKKGILGPIPLMDKIDSELCYVEPVVCDSVIEFICGKHNGAFNDSRMDVMAANEPGGTSVRNLIHWAQEIHTDKYQAYDFGSAGVGAPHARCRRQQNLCGSAHTCMRPTGQRATLQPVNPVAV